MSPIKIFLLPIDKSVDDKHCQIREPPNGSRGRQVDACSRLSAFNNNIETPAALQRHGEMGPLNRRGGMAT